MWEEDRRVERRVRLGPSGFGDRWGGVLGALLLAALLTLTIGGGVFGAALSGVVLFPDGPVGRDEGLDRSFSVAAVVLAGAVVLLVAVVAALALRFARTRVRTELVADADRLEWVRPRGWRLPERSFSVPWNRVQAVRATTVPGRRGDGYRVVDVYLYVPAARVPRWVGARDPSAREWKSGGLGRVSAPAARVRVGGPRPWERALAEEVADAVDRVRPDVTAQDTPADSWFVPGAAARRREPGQGPEPVWVDQRMSPLRWVRIASTWLAALVLFSVGVASDLWYPLVGGLSAIPWAVSMTGLSVWLCLAPRWLGRRGIRVDSAGLTFVQEGTLWLRNRGLYVHLPWAEVLVAEDAMAGVARRDSARAGAGNLVDLYLTPAERAARWASLGAVYVRRHSARHALSLTNPVSCLHLDLMKHGWTRRVSAGDLLRVIALFRPDLVR